MWAQIPSFRRRKTGPRPEDFVIEVNPLKDYAVPFDLTPDKVNGTHVVTLAANQQGAEVPMTARHDGPIEGFAIKAIVLDSNNAPVAAPVIRVEIQHVGKRKLLMNRPIDLRTIMGDAGRPYVLPETIFLPAIQSLTLRLFNDENAERRVEFVVHGVKYYEHAAPDSMRKELYEYTERRERTYTYWQTTDQVVALGGSATGVSADLTMPDDADFEIMKATCASDAAFRVDYVDGGTDRAYTASRIHDSLFFGGFSPTAIASGAGGVFPSRWATSLLVRRGIKNRFVMDNLSAQTNNVFITLAGRKISYV